MNNDAETLTDRELEIIAAGETDHERDLWDRYDD